MAVVRLALLVAALWLLEFIFFPQVPLLSLLIDPLFLVLVFVGLHVPSTRFLWAQGFCLGMLKDLTTGAFFGGFAVTFGLIGWLIGAGRHLVEREDPVTQAIWTCALAAIRGVIYGVLLTIADPALGGNRWWWASVPLSVLINGACAFWIFPYAAPYLSTNRRR